MKEHEYFIDEVIIDGKVYQNAVIFAEYEYIPPEPWHDHLDSPPDEEEIDIYKMVIVSEGSEPDDITRSCPDWLFRDILDSISTDLEDYDESEDYDARY